MSRNGVREAGRPERACASQIAGGKIRGLGAAQDRMLGRASRDDDVLAVKDDAELTAQSELLEAKQRRARREACNSDRFASPGGADTLEPDLRNVPFGNGVNRCAAAMEPRTDTERGRVAFVDENGMHRDAHAPSRVNGARRARHQRQRRRDGRGLKDFPPISHSVPITAPGPSAGSAVLGAPEFAIGGEGRPTDGVLSSTAGSCVRECWQAQ